MENTNTQINASPATIGREQAETASRLKQTWQREYFRARRMYPTLSPLRALRFARALVSLHFCASTDQRLAQRVGFMADSQKIRDFALRCTN